MSKEEVLTPGLDALEALEALGVLPEGYCFCGDHGRDALKPEHEHTGECRDARAAIRSAREGAPRTVLVILETTLRAGGFDGLWNGDGECACLLGDLAPCDALNMDCRAGYRAPCSHGGEHDWDVSADGK